MVTLGLGPDEKKAGREVFAWTTSALGVCASLMENPDVLILDEPLTQWIRLRWKKFTDLLQQFKRDGKTIILASHSATDIEKGLRYRL